MVWLRFHFFDTKPQFARSVIDNREKIFCETSVGRDFNGSVFDVERWRGPRTGRVEAPRTGDGGLVREGVPGNDIWRYVG